MKADKEDVVADLHCASFYQGTVRHMKPDWNALRNNAQHRPWPVPERSWAMTMSWRHLLASHWSVYPDLLAPSLPDGLTLDTWEGKAWLSIVPFEMANVSPRGLTWWPGGMSFPELNLRTYVHVDGQKPGVWFYSLDAASRITVMGARRFFHLPYFMAEMKCETHESPLIDEVRYESVRTHSNAPPAEFFATYRPTGKVLDVDPNSFDYWIMERYCLYSANREGKVFRCDVHHQRWPLRPATVDIERNTLFEAIGLDLPAEPAKSHFVRNIDTLGWGLEEA